MRGFRPLRQCSADKVSGASHGRHGNGDDEAADLRRQLAFSRDVPRTERYCLEKGGMHVMPVHLTLLADCAEMCQKTANPCCDVHHSMPRFASLARTFAMLARKSARQ